MLGAGRGDLGYSWRQQEPRSLEDIDFLLQRQEQLRQALPQHVSEDIAKYPENYADAESFRIFHAKSRFRATFTTIGATVAAVCVLCPMLGMPNGRQLIRKYSLIAYPAMIGTWCTSYFFWNRWNGWTHLERNKF